MSPKGGNRSRSYHSNSQEGTQTAGNAANAALLHHRSLSPQVPQGSNSAGPRKQASSQSRKHGANANRNTVSQVVSSAEESR